MKKNIALIFGGSACSADRNCGRRLWRNLEFPAVQRQRQRIRWY